MLPWSGVASCKQQSLTKTAVVCRRGESQFAWLPGKLLSLNVRRKKTASDKSHVLFFSRQVVFFLRPSTVPCRSRAAGRREDIGLDNADF